MEQDPNYQNENHKLKAHLVAIITIIFWSSAFISTKLLLRDFTPTEILFYRFILAYAVLFIACPRFVRYNNIREELLFAGAGFTGVTMYYIFQNTSLRYTLASNEGILISVAPFFTAILSYFLIKKDPIRKSFLFGFLLSIIGITLISFNGNFVLKLNPLGDFLAICCAVVWAIYSILIIKLGNSGYNTIQCTRKIFFYGIVLLLPLLPFFDFHLRIERFSHLPLVLHMVFLGAIASALCFVTWNYAIRILGPVRTNIYIYFSPVATVAISAVVLHERITLVAAAGVVLILFGLLLSDEKAFLPGNKKRKGINLQ